MSNFLNNTVERFGDMATAGVLSAFGGFASYLYHTYKNDVQFRFFAFFTNAALAFFLGNVISGFIPRDMAWRDSLMMVAGFSAYPCLQLLEIYTVKFAEKFLNAKLGE